MQANPSAPACPLPSTGFLRLPQIIGNTRGGPPVAPLIPVCASTWWAGVKSGRYPQPVKLSPRVTVWRVEDIRQLIASAKGSAE
jgi:predicted DNA-binding transcriptional regulator AlpA